MNKKSENTITRSKFLRLSTGSLIGVGVTGMYSTAFIKRVHAANNIEYRTLGKTGLKVTAVGLGGSRTNEPSIVKRTFDMGINFVDTGRMYAGGRNEEMIGKVAKNIRKEIIIQSKVDQGIQQDNAAFGKSIDESLKALQTDYIDIMLIRGAATEEMVKNPVVEDTFLKAKEEGKIRFCGFSTHSPKSDEILRAGVDAQFYDVAMIPYNHLGSFHHTVYGIYSEWDQEALEKEIENAVASGMGIIAMKTCSAGPFKTDEDPRGSYQAGLKWILRNKNICSMAVGMGSFREIEEDFGAMS